MTKTTKKSTPPRRRTRRARRLPQKDAALVRALMRRLRWWAKMLDRATRN